MRKLVAFGLLLGLSFTHLANASVASLEETFLMGGCNKCEKKECKGRCDKKEKKRACCKKGKSCKKKEDKEKTKEKKVK